MIEVIEQCERLVVYGLSFDPLDAELGVVVASAAAKLKEILIVDPQPGIVGERVAALVLPARPKIEMRTIEPAA